MFSYHTRLSGQWLVIVDTFFGIPYRWTHLAFGEYSEIHWGEQPTAEIQYKCPLDIGYKV